MRIEHPRHLQVSRSCVAARRSPGPLAALLLALALVGCVDHEDSHHIPAEVEAAAQTMVFPMALGAADYGPANWVASPNYVTANRGKGQIKKVIVHTVQGSYAGCISWFKNPSAKVSAHFVVSKNGEVTQMVKEKDIGWHVGSENGYTVGIEHEGYVTDPAWVTPKMLAASAQLTCYLLKKYGLPADRVSVMGHVELPNQTHTDPGKYWPWNDYMAQIKACVGGTTPPTCPTSCDDKNACTKDECVNGNCVNTNDNGIVCWDGDACTAGEKCSNGKCVGGSIVKDCNDNNACTNDGCTAGNCTHANNTAACNDGNACTNGDACNNGGCAAGAAKSCDDNNPCTADACTAATGACTHTPKTAGCDDGNPCTVGDGCDAKTGGCVAGTPKVCDDGDPCTVGDGCDAKTGACTAGAAKPCDDGNPCTLGDGCDKLTGGCKPGAAKVCGGPGEPCTTGTCNPATGKCAPANEGKACDDDNPCTTGSICTGGECFANGLKGCEDGNPCTHDSCAGGTCVHTPHTQFCDDGNGCTVGDVCQNAVCTGSPLSCEDGDPCTLNPPCAAGACAAGVPTCDDGNDCTADSCSAGDCSHTPLASGDCDDDDPCTAKNTCSQGICSVGAQVSCSDGEACTTDRCVAGKGCEHTQAPDCGDASGGGADASSDPRDVGLAGDDGLGTGNPAVTPMSAASSGCSAAPAAPASSRAGWLGLCALALGLVALRRRCASAS